MPEQEMSRAAGRVEAFQDEYAGRYELRTVPQLVSGMQPVCLRCYAYVHDLEEHDLYHEDQATIVDLLQCLHHGLTVFDEKGDPISIPHRLGELKDRLVVG